MNITKRPEFKEKFVEQSQDVFKVMSNEYHSKRKRFL